MLYIHLQSIMIQKMPERGGSNPEGGVNDRDDEMAIEIRSKLREGGEIEDQRLRKIPGD
jgi:hypothetical protein